MSKMQLFIHLLQNYPFQRRDLVLYPLDVALNKIQSIKSHKSINWNHIDVMTEKTKILIYIELKIIFSIIETTTAF
jgi:hypothetical protein